MHTLSNPTQLSFLVDRKAAGSLTSRLAVLRAEIDAAAAKAAPVASALAFSVGLGLVANFLLSAG